MDLKELKVATRVAMREAERMTAAYKRAQRKAEATKVRRSPAFPLYFWWVEKDGSPTLMVSATRPEVHESGEDLTFIHYWVGPSDAEEKRQHWVDLRKIFSDRWQDTGTVFKCRVKLERKIDPEESVRWTKRKAVK